MRSVPDSMFRQVTQNNWVAVVFSDTTGIITYSNAAANNLYGYANDELIGLPSSTLAAYSDEIPAVLEEIREQKGWSGEMIQKKKDGTIFTALLAVWLTYDENNNPNGMASNSLDISARKSMEREIKNLNIGLGQKVEERTAKLKEVNKELEMRKNEIEDAYKDLESFSYSVSHDLKAPIRIIDGYSDLILKKHSQDFDAEDNDFLLQIRQSVKKMNILIEALLDLAKYGKKEIKKTEVNVKELVEATLMDLKKSSPEYNPTIILRDMPNTIADYDLLAQVFFNLISNAIKYSSKKEKPVVEIGVLKKENETIYYVKDNGAGFNMKYAQKLFTAFQRLHNETEFAGTGVGLAITQKIINRLGGKIWAEAKENEGATFYFKLPG